MRATLASTCINETIKEICRSYEQSRSTPIDDKMINYSDAGCRKKFTRRHPALIYAGLRRPRFAARHFHEADKDMCCSH